MFIFGRVVMGLTASGV